jgi:beta-lactamase superfamily II metal-dependent hydrolase
MLEIKVWDVSHGSAAWVKFPNGVNMVVDLGADGSGDLAFSPLRTMRSVHDVQQVDYAAISHGHADHLDDIFKLHHLFHPRVLITPRHLTDQEIRADNQSGDMKLVDRYLLLRQSYSSPITPDVDATVPTNIGGASFKFFAPSMCSRQSLNNHSLVVVISYCDMIVVIPGDNEAPSWKELMKNPAFLTAVRNTTILIAPHHGREAGFCAELLDLMKPQLVVVSDGGASDTSATGRYSAKAAGCRVVNGLGTIDTRKCLTTRTDGHITLKLGMQGLTPTYWVSTSKPLPSLIPPPFMNFGRSTSTGG